MISREEFLERIEVAEVLTLVENDELREDFEDDLIEDYLKAYVRVSENPDIQFPDLLLTLRRSKDSYRMMLDNPVQFLHSTFGRGEQYIKALTFRIAATDKIIEIISCSYGH